MAARGLEICLLIFRCIPVVFITAIIVWSYYAYIIQMCILKQVCVELSILNAHVKMDVIPQKVFYMLFYHPLLFMFCWSYWKTIFTPVGTPTSEFYLTDEYRERFDAELDRAGKMLILSDAAKDLPICCRTNVGDVRYCFPCKAIKPDRCHHCSICDKCVLKMDHHCPWVNNCVGYSNYKFFVLFLFYGFLYTFYVAMTSLQFFIRFWSDIGSGGADLSNLHIVFLFFASIMFSISLVSLSGYHCFLLARNRTTLESLQSPYFMGGADKNGFNLGAVNNFKQVFGVRKRFWLVPNFTSLGNGITYPLRNALSISTYHTMDNNHSISIPQSALGRGDVEVAVDNSIDESRGTEHLIAPDTQNNWSNGTRLDV